MSLNMTRAQQQQKEQDCLYTRELFRKQEKAPSNLFLTIDVLHAWDIVYHKYDIGKRVLIYESKLHELYCSLCAMSNNKDGKKELLQLITELLFKNFQYKYCEHEGCLNGMRTGVKYVCPDHTTNTKPVLKWTRVNGRMSLIEV